MLTRVSGGVKAENHKGMWEIKVMDGGGYQGVGWCVFSHISWIHSMIE